MKETKTVNSDQREEGERRSCELAGQFGHWGCGVCSHGLLYEQCEPCMRARVASHRHDPRRSYQVLHPDGRLYGDQGELDVRIAPVKLRGIVFVDFGTPLMWIAFSKEQAREFAKLITESAEELP
jgi:hypothetical protein